MPCINHRFVGQSHQFLAYAAHNCSIIAAAQIGAPHAVSKKRIARKKNFLVGFVKTYTTRRMSRCVQYAQFHAAYYYGVAIVQISAQRLWFYIAANAKIGCQIDNMFGKKFVVFMRFGQHAVGLCQHVVSECVIEMQMCVQHTFEFQVVVGHVALQLFVLVGCKTAAVDNNRTAQIVVYDIGIFFYRIELKKLDVHRS